MFKVQLRFRAYGTAHLADPKQERNPVLRFFLSTNVSTKMVTTQLFQEVHNSTLSTTQPVAPQTIEFHVSKANGMTEDRIMGALKDAILNIDGITELHTKLSEWARKNAGSNSVALVDLYGRDQRSVELPLCVEMAGKDYAPKMTIRIEPVGRVLIDGLEHTVPGTLKEVQDKRSQLHVMNEARLSGYVHASHYMFTKMAPTWPQVRRINCYSFTLRNGTSLPAIAYMQQRHKRVVDPRYFEQNLDIALEREGMTREELVKLAKTDPRVLNITMQTLMAWSNSALYVSDEAYLEHTYTGIADSLHYFFVERRAKKDKLQLVDLEEMELAEYYGADDCEGLALKIIRDGDALLHLAPAHLSAALKLVQDARLQYIFFLCLSGVTTGDIGGDFAALSSSSQPLGAHMFCLAVPVPTVLKWIGHCNIADPIFAALPADVASISKELPVMFGEGTGLLHPLPIPLPEHLRLALPSVETPTPAAVLSSMIKNVSQHLPVTVKNMDTPPLFCKRNNGSAHFPGTGTRNPAITNNSLWLTTTLQQLEQDAFRGVRKWYWWQENGASHFYRTKQVLFTHDFLRMGYGVTTFASVRRREDDDGSEPLWTVGTTIPDMFSSPSVMGLWAEPALTQEELGAINFEMMDAPPQPPLLPAPAPGINNLEWDQTAHALTQNEHERITATLREMQYASAHTGLVWLVELAKNVDAISGAVLGSLILCPKGSECKCGAWAVPAKVLGDKPDLKAALIDVLKLDAKASVQTVMEAIVKFEKEKLTRNDDYRLPIAPTYSVNRQQMLKKKRSAAMVAAMNRTHQMCWDTVQPIFVPVSLHWLSEQNSADVGSYMIQRCFIAVY